MRNKILAARGARYQNISKYSNTVIIIKANTPGINKNLWFSSLLVNIFTNIIKSHFNTNYEFFESHDGNYTLINLKNENHSNIKTYLVNLENTHQLGRFIDLDLYYNNRPLSRTDLGIPLRKCYICGRDAFICARNQTHKLKILLNKIEESVINYLETYITLELRNAMKKELDLDYKFGLVEKNNPHSHEDMDYDLMLNSLNYISPMFSKYIQIGLKDLSYNKHFKEARKLGIKIENKMFKHSHNINTYKGSIFINALLITSLIITLKKNLNFDNVFSATQKLSTNIYDDFKINDNTFGKKAYKEFNIKGIRKEAFEGFPTVQEMLHKYNEINNDNLKSILIDLIIKADDTTLLKRAKTLEKYITIKLSFLSLDKNNLEEIKELHKKMVKDKISFGGAADLLIATIFLNNIKNKLFLN